MQYLAWGNVATDNHSAPKILKIHLKQSKCYQLGKEVHVFLGRTNDFLCPVAAVLTYIVQRGTSHGPFFIRTNGSPSSKSYSVARVCHAVGLPCQHFAGHSFRIGAATTVAKPGIEDSTICMLGRWNSTLRHANQFTDYTKSTIMLYCFDNLNSESLSYHFT